MLSRIILEWTVSPISVRYNFILFMAFGLLIMSAPSYAQSGNPRVGIMTSKGPIVIEVFANATPVTASNFLDLVGRGFYDGLTFHRVEADLIQGGDPRGNGTGVFVDPQTGRPRLVPLEIDRRLSHRRAGVVAMARPGNNINGNSCQFYIVKRPVAYLDGKYSIFGGVLNGMNVVNQIQRGDRIMYAKIITASGSSGSSHGSGGSGGSGGSQNPKPLVPPDDEEGPEDLEDSGF